MQQKDILKHKNKWYNQNKY